MFSLYLQVVFLLFCVAVGFLIAIPVGIVKSKYHGACLLYGKFDFDSPEVLQPGSAITCNFCIFSGSVSLLIGLILLCGTLYLTWRKRFGNLFVPATIAKWDGNDKLASKPLIGAWIQFCASTIMMLLTFVTACLISSGFHDFCENGLEKAHEELKRCVYLESFIGSFHKELSISQISAWLGSVCWFVIMVIARIKVRSLKPKRLPSLSSDNMYQHLESPAHL